MSAEDREAGRLDGLREAATVANEIGGVINGRNKIEQGQRRAIVRAVSAINRIIERDGGEPIELYEGLSELSGARHDRLGFGG